MDTQIHPVRAYRLAQKPALTLADLANRLGTTKANLSRIESGKQGVSNKLLQKLVSETGISADRLRPDLAHLFAGAPQRRRAHATPKRRRAA